MKIKVDSALSHMKKSELKTIIRQYEIITENLNHQILLLKYQIFLETPNLQFKIPVQIWEEDEPDDFPDIPTIVDPNLNKFRKRDVAYQ